MPCSATEDEAFGRNCQILVGENIVLRELRESDLTHTHRWVNDRNLKLYSGPYHPVSELETRKWYEKVSLDTNSYIFVIETSTEQRVIGICSLANIDRVARKAELRIKIGEREYWGQGYGVEATRLLVQFGFTDLNLHRIYLFVFEDNQRAIRAYEKCGFVREGQLKDDAFINGRYVDSIVMGITTNESGTSSA